MITWYANNLKISSTFELPVPVDHASLSQHTIHLFKLHKKASK